MPRLKYSEMLQEVDDSEAADIIIGLTRDDLHILSSYLGNNVQTKDELFLACQNLSTLIVNGQEVTLEPRLLQRLKSRCIGKQDFGKWLAGVVIQQLHDYCGW